MSFVDALQELKRILENDAALLAFLAANFERPLTVRLVYKNKEEIQLGELPIILITRPEKTGEADNTVEGFYDNIVLLYLGFHCDDTEQGQLLLIQFEEFVESAIMRNMTLSDLVSFTKPGPSRNDQGMNHPQYFIVKSMTVSQEVTW
jgi:hypothetical protein